MPFGLKNIGITYQRAMIVIFHDIIGKEIENYVDDLVVKSVTRDTHFSNLEKFFSSAVEPIISRWIIKKCTFKVSAIKFLEFLVHQKGVNVDPAKIKKKTPKYLP